MAYLGKTPSQATRSRFYYTSTGGETSLSGADDNGNTLVFSDGNYVDVMLNGVTLVAGTDYNTTTANTIGGLTALTASDVVEVVVYDTFSVFGGNVQGDFSVTNGALKTTDITAVDANGIQFNTDEGTERARIDDSGRLLVGTTDTNPTTTSDNGIAIQDDGRIFGHRGDWALSRSGDGAFMNFFESTGGTRSSVLGSIGISGGGLGISFDGGSNYLDDYEEGTWTPSINFTSATYANQEGTYTKIGRFVHATCYINVGTVTTSGTSNVTLSGLPFSASSGNIYHAGVMANYSNIDVDADTVQIAWNIGDNQTVSILRNMKKNAGFDNITCNQLNSSTAFYATFMYQTNA